MRSKGTPLKGRRLVLAVALFAVLSFAISMPLYIVAGGSIRESGLQAGLSALLVAPFWGLVMWWFTRS